MKDIKNMTAGIIGLGHLGGSIAQSMIKGGFPKENMMISHKGSARTYLKAVEMGISQCLVKTEILMEKADIVILAAKPQDLENIGSNPIRNDALLLSFMAAVPLEMLKDNFRCAGICRAMCSGPETIARSGGIGVIYPEIEMASAFFSLCGIKRLPLTFEEEIDAFTVGICIPPLLMNTSVSKDERDKALSGMAKSFPIYDQIGKWIERELTESSFYNKERALENVSTKGGISEAMTISIKAGETFSCAIKRGMTRCSEIRSAIQAKIPARTV